MEAQYLILKLLKRNPIERINLKEIYKSSWFLNHSAKYDNSFIKYISVDKNNSKKINLSDKNMKFFEKIKSENSTRKQKKKKN